MGKTDRYLLDTHTFLWAISETHKLGKQSLKILENLDSIIYVSAVSAYEIAYKNKIGKLSDFDYVISNFEFILNHFSAKQLDLTVKHALFAAQMNWKHRDPFDRMLAAQALCEDFIFITKDSVFNELVEVNTVW